MERAKRGRGKGRGNKLIAALNAHAWSKPPVTGASTASGKVTTIPIDPIVSPSVIGTEVLVKKQLDTIKHSQRIAKDFNQRVTTSVQQQDQVDVEKMTEEEMKKKIKEQQQEIRRYQYSFTRLEGDLAALEANFIALGDKATMDQSSLLGYVKDQARTDIHFEPNKIPGAESLIPPQASTM